MTKLTKLFCVLVLCLFGVASANAGDKVYATFENPQNTNAVWDSETSSFSWTQSYYNQIGNVGLPKGDISDYKKLVVNYEIKEGDQFRILFYQGGSNIAIYVTKANDGETGTKEINIYETLSADANFSVDYILNCTEIKLSGAGNSGKVKINSMYLETYDVGEDKPNLKPEEDEADPGKPAGDFVSFTEVFPNLQPRIGIGADSHPIKLGNGDVVVGQRTKDVIADLSGFTKLTMVTSPNLMLVLYMNHEVDAQQNAGDYAAEDAGKYVFMDVQADENGLIEVDLTQFDKQELNCICLPWNNSNKGTVWYILLTEKDGKTVYLNPAIWNVDNARFAAYMYNGNEANAWTDFATVEGAEGIFSATIPARFTGLVLCRMNGETTENNWDNKWNQSVDITPVNANALYTITGWGEGENAKSTIEETVYGSEPVVGIIPDGTYYVMSANEGTLINAENALDAKGTPITFTFNAATNTYAIEGADFFAGKQWTIADAVEGMSGFYTISTAEGFLAVSATNTLEQIADGTADAAVWILLQKAYWEDIVNSTYTVAGTKNLTGTEKDWEIAEANQMVLNEETGLFEKKFKRIAIDSENQPEFKVVQTNMEGENTWYPTGDNWVITTNYVGGEGLYDITITFDPSDFKEIGVIPAKRITFPDNAVVYDFEAAADAGENPANKNGSAANGQAFYGWENPEKTDSKRQDYKGYEWAEGSVLPEECHIWRRSDRINGNVAGNGGLKCPSNKEMAIDGLNPGDKVIIVYDAENATDKEIIWAIGDGSSDETLEGPRATATINGVEAVTGETTIASGAEILVNSVTPADNGTGYFVFQVKKGMVIQQIAVIPSNLNTYTATFTTNAGWEKAYAYAWSGDGENVKKFLGDWPGTELTAAEGVYNVTFKATEAPEFIIFNNGLENDAKQQTADLAFENGKAYEFNITKPEPIIPAGRYYILAMAEENDNLMAAGHNWGTKGIINGTGLDITLTYNESNDTYDFDSRVSNGGDSHFLGSNLFMDSSSYGWSIEEADYGHYICSTFDGVKKYIGINLNRELELTETPYAWAFINADWWENNLLDGLKEATATAPIDATFLIKCADFNRNDQRKSAWTMEAGNQNLNGGCNGEHWNTCAESWHSVFTLTQALGEVPAGVYAMTAQGFYRQDGSDNDNLPYFYANDEKQTFPLRTGSENGMDTAGDSFLAGKYTIDPIYVQVDENGTLTVGAKLENNTNLWCIFDNFQLKYYGKDASIDQLKNAALFAKVGELFEQLGTLIHSGDIEIGTVNSELLDVYNANKPADITTAEQANAAIEALTAAIEKGEAYVNAKNVLPKMKQLTESTNVYTTEAYEEYYGQWYQKYEAAELTVAEANALQDPFVVTGWHASITCDNFLLSAWDTNADFNDAAYYINTWSVEGENDGSNFKVPFFEYWTGDGDSLGEKTLTATMTGLEAGGYDVTALVRVRAKNGYTAPAYGITLQANNGDLIDVCAGTQVGESQFYLDTFTAKGEVGEDGTLKIKFIVAADNNISWLSFQNVKFAKDIATGITTVNVPVELNNGVVYNLAGQKVQKAQKGLYIINGKKVIK